MTDAHSKTLKVIKEYEQLCDSVLRACNEKSDKEAIISDSIDDGIEFLNAPIIGIPLAGLSIIGGFITAGIKDLEEYFRNKELERKAWEAIEDSFDKISKNSNVIIPEGKEVLKTYVLDKIYSHFIKNDLKSYIIQNYKKKELCTKNLNKAIILQFATYKDIALGDRILTLSNNYKNKLRTDLKDFQNWIKKTIQVDFIKCYKKAKEDVYNLLVTDCNKKDKEKIDYIFTLQNGLVPIDFDFTHENELSKEIEEAVSLQLLFIFDGNRKRKFPAFYYNNSNFKNLIDDLTDLYRDSVFNAYDDENIELLISYPIFLTIGAIIIGLILRLIFKNWVLSIILTVGTLVLSYAFGIFMIKDRNKTNAESPFRTIKKYGKNAVYSKLKTIKTKILKNELKKASTKGSGSMSLIVKTPSKIKQDKVQDVSLDVNIETPKLTDVPKENYGLQDIKETTSPSSIMPTLNEDEIFGALEDFVNTTD